MIPTDRYCHSGPSNGDNSILTKLSVMPFCHGGGGSIIVCYCRKHVFNKSTFKIHLSDTITVTIHSKYTGHHVSRWGYTMTNYFGFTNLKLTSRLSATCYRRILSWICPVLLLIRYLIYALSYSSMLKHGLSKTRVFRSISKAQYTRWSTKKTSILDIVGKK